MDGPRGDHTECQVRQRQILLLYDIIYMWNLANTLFQQNKRTFYTWTSPMVKTETRWIIFFAAKYREALYSQQKQDRELTVAQTMNSLLPNSDLN